MNRITPHSRFPEFREHLRAYPHLFTKWTGTMFRFQTINFPTPKDVLSGAGARSHGGRWNAPGLAALYGSISDSVALEECKASDRYYGLITKSPRLVVAIEVQLQ